ncbi:alcohol dehydogenase [Cubamyces sp. BRFM 1775]|nr:alcohol dehydogenase [Cubamyces sp. BRFM 1775]
MPQASSGSLERTTIIMSASNSTQPQSGGSPSGPSGTMTAYRFVPGKAEPQKEVVPIPTPGPDEVLVKILAAGVCHSDCHLLEPPPSYPTIPYSYTLGHEGAGVVAALGEKVAKDPEASRRFAIGTYVAVLTTNACGSPECDSCSRGLPNLCFSVPKLGIGVDGCWAEYIKARASTIVPVPGNDPSDARLAPGIVAAATDAVLTPWHALTRVAEVKRGQNLVIFGCGGLGLNAIQIAKNVLGAGTVIASDIKPESLAVARKVGADFAVKPSDVKALLAERRILVDVVVDVVGVQSTVDVGVDILRPAGTLLVVGLGAEKVELRLLTAAMKQLVVQMTFGGDCRDLEECLDAIAAGKVKPEVEERPMDECGKVVCGLAKGEIRARVALMPRL